MEIETSKTLEENIKNVLNDTGYQVFQNTFFYQKSVLRGADTLRNEDVGDEIADYLKYVLVLPFEAKYNKKLQTLSTRNDPDNFVPNPVTLNGHPLLKVINTKGLVLSANKVIKLPKR